MAKVPQRIPNMPDNNWEWQGQKGQTYTYKNIAGEEVQGFGKHFHNVATGENLPVRQGQDIQRRTKLARGETPIPAAQRTTQRAIRHRAIPATKGRSAKHGRTINIYYRTLEEARIDFLREYENPNSFVHAFPAWVIEISWTNKKAVANTNTSKKNLINTGRKTKTGRTIYRTAPLGYATLSSSWWTLEAMVTTEVPWQDAYARYQDYDMGKRGRVILFGGEK
jgi:hypothetical protein